MSVSADRLHNFGFLIKDIGRLFSKLFEYEANHLGITLAEARVLSYLSRNPGLNQAQLAELSGVEPMSLVRILDRMAADRRIERRAHPTDRRARQLHVQAQGQATLDQIWKLSAQLRSQVLAGFKAEERNALMTLLERVHEQMLLMLAEQADKPSHTQAGAARRARKPSSRTKTVAKKTSVAALLRGQPGKSLGKSRGVVR